MSEQDTAVTPVMFRRWPSTYEYDGFHRKHVWVKGSVIALFPTIPGTYEAHTFSSYEHVGQHGAADRSVIYRTKRATPEEYADLKAELESAPYGYRLEVYQRFQPGWEKERAKALRADPSGTVA